jgi:hypothetical protein
VFCLVRGFAIGFSKQEVAMAEAGSLQTEIDASFSQTSQATNQLQPSLSGW